MKTSNILAAAALTLLAAAGAHAETYEGVQPLTSGYSRADVAPQAVAAARAGNAYNDSEGAASTATPALTASVDRAAVRSQAVVFTDAATPEIYTRSIVGSVRCV